MHIVLRIHRDFVISILFIDIHTALLKPSLILGSFKNKITESIVDYTVRHLKNIKSFLLNEIPELTYLKLIIFA